MPLDKLVVKRNSRPSLPYDKIKDVVLSERYELSLAFIDKRKSRELNRIYRKKDYSTNVLSFPITKNSGEILIDLETARVETKKFGMTYRTFVLYLFIHGLLHLKGMRHGAKMELAERKFLNFFEARTHGSTHRSRH